MAGLSCAGELTRAGRRVALLEADRIAAGVTGYTTAKLSSLHTLVYERLRRTRGADGARAYAQSQQGAVERVAEIAELLDIKGELERFPAFTFGRDPVGADRLRAEAAAAKGAGLAASFQEPSSPHRTSSSPRTTRSSTVPCSSPGSRRAANS